MRKLSGINFNNIYDLSSCSSYHNLLWQKFELPQSTSSKNPGQIQIIPQVRNLLNMFKTKYYIYIYIKHSRERRNSDRISKTRLVFFSHSGDLNRRKVNNRCNDADRQRLYIRSECRYNTGIPRHRHDKTAKG